MRTSPARGRWAEDTVARWLEGQGCLVRARNVRLAGGEIDLVIREGEVDVFVEVKARRREGRAAEAVSWDKRRRLARAAALWAARNGVPRGGCRFDVVTVEGEGAQAVIRRIRGAFEAPARFDI